MLLPVVPVGLGSQDAAIAAAATLGLQYEVLRESATEGIQNALAFRREVAERHLQRLTGNQSPK